MHNELNELFNPKKYSKSININGISKNNLTNFLRKMLLIRKVENKVATLLKQKIINCPSHLCTGQEAISVGVLSNCKKGDMIYGNHRSHGHYLALGGNVKKFFYEVQGKVDGCSNGMGGSMHLVDRKVGFEGSVPIVAGTIPIAVGAALKSKLKKDKSIAIAFFGDGACEEGTFHESLNFASINSLPIIFVAENNLFSSHLDIHLRQPSNKLSRYATAHKIENYCLDGNDVTKIFRTVRSKIKKLRSGSGPLFLECVTYRHLGHVGPETDIDVGVNRKIKDLNLWKRNDPIKRMINTLVKKNILKSNEISKVEEEIIKYVEREYIFTLKKKIKKNKSLKNYIY